MFKPQKIKNKLSKDDLSNSYKYPAYSADSTNNGVVGYTDHPEFICSEATPVFVIFGDHTRTINIARKSFSVLDNVKVLLPLPGVRNSNNVLFFIISVWKKQIPDLGYARHWKVAEKCVLPLPTKNGKIDFDFMESFIAELEAQRMAKLKAYLKASGFSKYKLSLAERNVLQEFRKLENDQWGEYRIGDLFQRIKTNKLPYKAEELPKQATGRYLLPCLTSSFQNQGLNYFAPKEGATILRNVISIPSNSDVYRAYYQSREFTVLSDAYAIRWKSDAFEPSPNQYLFMVMCINKVTDLPIYSYKNKLGGWNVVKNKYIQLPQKDGEIDFSFMETLISVIKKLAIKDVVLYSKVKTNTTKQIASYERSSNAK